jgi:hypothetical protein
LRPLFEDFQKTGQSEKSKTGQSENSGSQEVGNGTPGKELKSSSEEQ